MAEMALTAATRKTADILGTLAVEECTRLYWMEEDIKWIQTELRFIHAFLKDADVEVKQSMSQGMANLIVNIRDLAYDAENIIDTFFPEIETHKRNGLVRYLECLCCSFCNWYTGHRFVMEIEAIRRRVTEINHARLTYGIADKSKSLEVGGEEWDPKPSFPHDEKSIIVGLETHIKGLEELLAENEKYCVIPIIGLPGVGKTTLARKVFNLVKTKYDCHAWVCASRKPRVRDLLQCIARQIGVDKDADIEANLYKFLRQKRHLIFIDDIWSTETWDALTVGIPDNCENGSALIITSRYRKVGNHAHGDSSLLELQPLDEMKSWELFSKIVKLPPHCPDEIVDSPRLLEIGREILRKCGGLPLRIVAIVLLRNERMDHIWEGMLKQLGQEEDQTFTILAFSYNDLPSHLKPCFLYFGLFSEDHEYPASEMINLWIAEGYIKPQKNHTLEDVWENYLIELTRRSLIQIGKTSIDGRIKSCLVHDEVHRLCVSIAKDEKIFTTCHDCYFDLDTSLRGVAIHDGSISDYISRHQSPNLRALLYFNKQGDILRRKHLVYHHKLFRFIRVLCLKGLMLPRSFPTDINNFIHLRYLRLRRSGLGSIPSTISNLKNLQTFDVQDCENLILPAVIWKMQSLRHILLSPTATFRRQFKSRCTERCSQVIEEVCLPNLQSLCTLKGDFFKAECLSKFTNLRKLGICCRLKRFVKALTDILLIPKKLEKLNLIMQDDVNKFLPIDIPEGSSSIDSVNQNFPKPAGPVLNFSGYENLRVLYLEGPVVQLPEFTTSLVKLTLVQNRLEQDPMEDLGKLQSLKNLQLRRGCYVGSVNYY